MRTNYLIANIIEYRMRDWKACIRQKRIGSSNLPHSAPQSVDCQSESRSQRFLFIPLQPHKISPVSQNFCPFLMTFAHFC